MVHFTHTTLYKAMQSSLVNSRRMLSFAKRNKNVTVTSAGRLVRLSRGHDASAPQFNDGSELSGNDSHGWLSDVLHTLSRSIFSWSWWTNVDDAFTGPFKQMQSLSFCSR
jgi:asparagine synthetase A